MLLHNSRRLRAHACKAAVQLPPAGAGQQSAGVLGEAYGFGLEAGHVHVEERLFEVVDVLLPI